MSFYNPYMKTPDYGQGIQDFASQLMQMLMMRKMMGDSGGGGKSPLPATQAGQSSAGGILGGAPQMGSAPQTGSVGGGMGGMDPQTLAQLIQALQGMGIRL